MKSDRKFIVANLLRSSSDSHAQALDQLGLLRKYFVGNQKPTVGIDPEKQIRQPAFVIANILFAKVFSNYPYECMRFAICPIFEQWVRRYVQPGDHLIAGFGYFNRLIPRIQEAGGKVFLDARNSHPSSFWSLVAEEYARWDISLPPIWTRHHMRQQRSAALADYVIAPSRFVADSFIERGFPEKQVFRLPYPVDLSRFRPSEKSRPDNRPLTLVSSGLLTLRKGSPYLFEAFKLIRKQVPDARLKLIDKMADNFKPVFKRHGYDKIPVEWSPMMGHERLSSWLTEGDIFVLPTIEEGMVRSAAEALACGLPVITTRNAGVDDFIINGVNGSIVPIRDPQAIANAVLEWWEKIKSGTYDPREQEVDRSCLGIGEFTGRLKNFLESIGEI